MRPLVGLTASLLGLAACSSPAAGAPRPDGAGGSVATAPAGPDTLTIGGARIDVAFGSGHLDLSRAQLIAWVTTAATAVTAYFGRFPVAHYRVVIEPVSGRSGVLAGTTWAYGGAHTQMRVGEHVSIVQLEHDWVMTHEMVHTAFPDQPPEHHWIEEGTATYVEPLARLWVGNYVETRVWSDLVGGLPNGLPRDGDRGLDHTHTWGRTYWGGALFCLLADLEIRERTAGRLGLVDALRGMVAAGGSDQVDWSIERAFREADRAIGAPVLEELYRKMKDAPVEPDLDALWRDLGVAVRHDAIELDDKAPRAALRRAITARPPQTVTPATPAPAGR
jgi:hypothetical protein